MNWNSALIKKSRPVVNKLKKFPEVIAIGFAGSIGAGLADRHSDIDITAFVTKMPDPKSRKKVWGKYKDYLAVPGAPIDLFNLGITELNIYYQLIDHTKGHVDRFVKDKNEWEEINIERLVHTKIVHDPKNVIKTLLKKVTPYPKWLKERTYKKIIIIRSGMKKMNTMLKRQNWFLIDKLFSAGLTDLVHVIYGLNSRYFTRDYWPRWFVRDIKRFKILPPHTYERLEEIMRLDNRANLIEKVEAFNSLINDLENLYKKQIKIKKPRQTKTMAAQHIKALKKTYAALQHL